MSNFSYAISDKHSALEAVLSGADIVPLRVSTPGTSLSDAGDEVRRKIMGVLSLAKKHGVAQEWTEPARSARSQHLRIEHSVTSIRLQCKDELQAVWQPAASSVSLKTRCLSGAAVPARATGQAIGQAAIQQSYRVLYRGTHVLLNDLAEAVANDTRKEFMEPLTTGPLLIIDDSTTSKCAGCQ